MSQTVEAINREVQAAREKIGPFHREVGKVIVGMRGLIDRLLLGLLTDGHILLEGLPGLAKTLAVRTVARTLQLHFSRIQFTPDLLPADVTGTYVFDRKQNEFTLRKGPLFCQVLLADEVNRAPAKTQSALLEAMQENQVTIEGTTLPLPQPFMVLATQNPVEQEGVYRLPEAQLDRFLLRVEMGYPEPRQEVAMLKLHSQPVGEVEGVGADRLVVPRRRQAADVALAAVVARRHPRVAQEGEQLVRVLVQPPPDAHAVRLAAVAVQHQLVEPAQHGDLLAAQRHHAQGHVFVFRVPGDVLIVREEYHMTAIG